MAAIAVATLMAPTPSAIAADQPDDVRAIVAQMLTDAETRSSLLQDSATAGHDGGFFMKSRDDAFRISPGGLLQFRYTYNHRKDAGDEYGFSMSRARLWLSGHVYDNISFYVRGQFSGAVKLDAFEDSRDTGGLVLDRAWVGFELTESLSLRLGQQVSELTRENEHSPQSQLGVASSPTDSVFGLGGFLGAQLHARGERMRAWLTFSNGARVVRTDFDDPRNADYALTAKVDYKFAGAWNQFSNFTSRRGSEFAAMFGAGVHWEQGADVGTPATEADLLMAVAELSFEGNGWNAYAAVNYAYNDIRTTSFGSDLGFVLQGGAFVSENVELYGRFDMVIPNGDRPVENDVFRTWTCGFNYFPISGTLAAKFSADLTYFFDAEATSIVGPSTNTSVLASADGDQFAIRVQFSLVF